MAFDRRLFSAAIQAHLLEKGLSLRKAAEQTGISASTISRMVNDAYLPDIDSFAALVRWLDTDANVFLDAPRGGEMRDNEKWSWLILCLNALDIPKELIEAIVTILRLVSNKKEKGNI